MDEHGAQIEVALERWLDAGGREDDPDSVAGLLRGVFRGRFCVMYGRVYGPGGWLYWQGTDCWMVGGWPRGIRDTVSTIGALLALAAAGVPLRPVAPPEAAPPEPPVDDTHPSAIFDDLAEDAAVAAPGEGEGTSAAADPVQPGCLVREVDELGG